MDTANMIIGIITVLMLALNFSFNRQNRHANEVNIFNERHSRLWEMKESGKFLNPEGFCYLFWQLQLDQFNSWRAGFLPKRIYQYWLETRKEQWKNDKELNHIKYKDSYDSVKTEWPKNEMFTFMDIVHTISIDEAFQTFPPNDILYKYSMKIENLIKRLTQTQVISI